MESQNALVWKGPLEAI